jgi:hypothetical protein
MRDSLDSVEQTPELPVHSAPAFSSDISADIETVEDTLYLPPLSLILSDEQKMAVIGLVMMTVNDLICRYERLESLVTEAKMGKHKIKTGAGLRDLVVADRAEASPLLSAQSPMSDDDTMDRLKPLSRHDSARSIDRPSSSKRPSRPPSVASSLTQVDRKPFAEFMTLQETIEDLVYFGRDVDGNLALCYAVKTWRSVQNDLMDRLFADLNISPKGKSISLFILHHSLYKRPLLIFRQNACLSSNRWNWDCKSRTC